MLLKENNVNLVQSPDFCGWPAPSPPTRWRVGLKQAEIEIEIEEVEQPAEGSEVGVNKGEAKPKKLHAPYFHT